MRISGRPSCAIDPGPWWKRRVGKRMKPDLAIGHYTRRLVDNQWFVVCDRGCEGNGVRAVNGGVATVRHNVGQAVDEGKRQQALAGEWLNIGPECAEMVRIADRDDSDARACYCGPDCARAGGQGRLSESVARIDPDEGRTCR